FSVNYDGNIPERHTTFHGPKGEAPFSYLLEQRFSSISDSAQLINVEGNNFLLSNTQQFPYFRSEFGIDKAVFLSQLLIVDMTSRQQALTYYRLVDKYGGSTGR